MWRSYFLVTLVWALIYLPRLGTLELKSEEGRRVLPAVTMMQTGNYIVPQVGSEPYLRKPPLVNWVVAGSFKLFGMRNEWAARLPSALCVLLVALAFLGLASGSAESPPGESGLKPGFLGPNGALAAAMMWLTNFGLLEKGRLIEIEALYVSLSALAFICWLSWWDQSRRRWLAWIGAGVFLGLALLAKGPLALLFFYSVVVAVLWQGGELRQLRRAPHFVGLLLMAGIFAVWVVPYFQMTEAGHTASVWSRQVTGRLSGDDFNFFDWLLNIPRGLAYLLPWIALFPFARFEKLESDAERRFAGALSLGIGLPFFFVSLVPGALPRYNMPLLAPAIWLLALFVRAHALVWPRQLRRAITWTVIAISGAMLIYTLAIIPFLLRREKVRPIARQLDAAIPPNEVLYAVDPEYQPYLFYLQRPVGYVSALRDLPRGARFILVQPEKLKRAEALSLRGGRHPQEILRIKDYRGKRMILLEAK